MDLERKNERYHFLAETKRDTTGFGPRFKSAGYHVDALEW